MFEFCLVKVRKSSVDTCEITGVFSQEKHLKHLHLLSITFLFCEYEVTLSCGLVCSLFCFHLLSIFCLIAQLYRCHLHFISPSRRFIRQHTLSSVHSYISLSFIDSRQRADELKASALVQHGCSCVTQLCRESLLRVQNRILYCILYIYTV